MSTPYLKLTDYSGNVYNFPPDFWITDDPFDTNKNVSNSFYAAGGRNIADGFLNPRFITIGGRIRGDTKAEFETKYRAFCRAILKGGYLEKTQDEVSRYIEVSAPDVQTSPAEGDRGDKFKDITVIFLAEKVFWKDSTQTIELDVVTGNDELTINNTGSDFIVLPIIEITADQAVAVPSIKMTNKNDGGMSFEYNDTNFDVGDVLVINCAEGTVKLNNGNTIENFNPGRFLRLQPGNNTIEYEGAAASIRFYFRKVYL